MSRPDIRWIQRFHNFKRAFARLAGAAALAIANASANAIVEAILTRYVAEFDEFQRRFLELERKEAP